MAHRRRMFAAAGVLLFILSLSALACSLPLSGGTATPGDTSPAAATATPTPTEPGVSAVPTAEPDEAIIYLIALEDNGASGPAVGCGDSLIEVRRPASAGEPVQAALEQLFAIKEQFLGESGLYNALWQSNLSVESVSIDDNGTATVRLTGSFLLGGTCDSPRFKAQIEQTVLRAAGVQAANILINGRPINEVLSQR